MFSCYKKFLLAREFPEIVHSLDILHKAKKLCKALAEVSVKFNNFATMAYIFEVLCPL